MHVIGTAGHVDHGKSALVQALTGIDPDRLQEEKERGFTIDLGFAWLTLPSGREVSVVDVPGHERFIKNMLAGAGGIDIALLIVAADEGPMPQTREHLAILDLLEVPQGIVVLTKIDLVDDEYADLVEAELDDVLAGSRLAGAPRVRTSARTGAGMDALLAELDAQLDRAPANRNLGRARLPIDRVFSISGFGTVVTGTLVDGGLAVGDEVELQPGGLRARVRSLQRHQTKVERLGPGTRAAVNLSGLRGEEIERGMVVTLPGVLGEVRAVDAHVQVPGIAGHPLGHNAGVTFLSGTAETEARIRLLDQDEIAPGGEGWAQIVLDNPVAVAMGDRYVVRTPNETVGGGRIVALNPRRHRRNDGRVLAELSRSLEGSIDDRLRGALAGGPRTRAQLAAELPYEAADLEAAISALAAGGEALLSGTTVVGVPWLAEQARRIEAAVGRYHAEYPLRSGAPREHVRTSAGVPVAMFEMALDRAVGLGLVSDLGERGVARAGHEPTLSQQQEAIAQRFVSEVVAGGTSPQPSIEPDGEMLHFLAQRGDVVVVGAGVVFSAAVYADARAAVVRALEEREPITLADVRDLLGTTRKYAQALLEHLDAEKVTRRVGDARVLRAKEARP